MKYDWNNIFLACSHCNNTKLDRYVGIIDPAEVNPENYIELELGVDNELREFVFVRKIKGGNDVDITIDLLNAVYNGIKTDIKKYACQQLKNKILHEIIWFLEKLYEYKQNNIIESKSVIEKMLSSDSVFSAFKRLIVRKDCDFTGKISY